MSMSLPVLVLVFLGVIVAVLGVIGAAIPLTVIGLVAIGFGGVLQVWGQKKS